VKNKHVLVLAFILMITASFITYQKITKLSLPVIPSESAQAWMIEAKLGFKASGRGAKVNFVLPDNPPGYLPLDEDFIASNYNLAIDYLKTNRVAQWVARRSSGPQTLYYRIEVTPEREPGPMTAPVPPYPDKPEYSGLEAEAIQSVIDRAKRGSVDSATLTRALLQHLYKNQNDESVAVLRKQARDPKEWVSYLEYMLHSVRIPTRIAHYLELKSASRNVELKPWLEIWNGEEWLSFNPVTGEPGRPDSSILWRYGNDPLLQVEGGSSPTVELSITERSRALVNIAEERSRKINSHLMDLSLFDLPVQTQNVYRLLMVLPIGALIVVLMRVLVGLPTFGVFMPVLIALAFRETHLLGGIIMFSLIVALALSVRFYFERLYLLLVPRVSAVLIVVLMTMIAVSLISHRLNIQAGLSIALFPLVIISMVVERMSVVWDETGPFNAIRQAAGSLFVASLCYWAMQDPYVRHWAFVFPETVLTVLAIVLLLGKYSGYRLLELWRFRHLISMSQPTMAGQTESTQANNSASSSVASNSTSAHETDKPTTEQPNTPNDDNSKGSQS